MTALPLICFLLFSGGLSGNLTGPSKGFFFAMAAKRSIPLSFISPSLSFFFPFISHCLRLSLSSSLALFFSRSLRLSLSFSLCLCLSLSSSLTVFLSHSPSSLTLFLFLTGTSIPVWSTSGKSLSQTVPLNPSSHTAHSGRQIPCVYNAVCNCSYAKGCLIIGDFNSPSAVVGNIVVQVTMALSENIALIPPFIISFILFRQSL